jgi:alpha-tubulin suppressor-like RCC1 family protein
VTITARSTLSSATATIRILAAVNSVELSGSDGRILLGESVQLSVVLRDQAGQALTGRPVSWESGSESIVPVTGSGLVTALRATPIPVVASAEGVADTLIVSGLMDKPLTDVAAGGGHTCGLTQAGTVYCWGHGGSGRLGGTAETGLPVRTTTPVTLASLAAGSLHTCGLTPAGAAWCWGADEAGQLGQAGVPPGDVVEVSGGKSFVRLALGGSESCGLTAAAEIWCWGANGAGQLGRGTGDQNVNASPDLVTGSHQFADVRVGGGFACGITTAAELWCWGANDFGQLGLGTVDDQAHGTPVRSLPGTTVRTVALGVMRACAAATDGTVQCWGNRLAPTPVPGVSGIVSLTAGSSHFCGLDAAGAMRCWGEVALYNLAYAPSLPIAGMTAGGLHTCARPAAGRVVCWGLNDGVQLGGATDGYGPVEVAGQP